MILYLFLAFYVFVVVFFLYGIYVKFLNPGAIYFPSTMETVERMLRLAGVDSRDTLVDFGSGDGRILIAAARWGARAFGYEIDPVLVWSARRKIRELELSNKIKIYCKNYHKADLKGVTVVTLYSFPNYMISIAKYIAEQIEKPVLVVTNQYLIPGHNFIKRQGNVYLYKLLPVNKAKK